MGEAETPMNREQWLTDVARQVEPVFRGFTLPPYRVACSWPCKNALSTRVRRLGECHPPGRSQGGYHEIFITPTIDDSLAVAGILVHEMAHVAAGCAAGHGAGYVKVCRHVGLTTAKPSVAAPNDCLSERLRKIIDRTGQYPHKALVLQVTAAKQRDPYVVLRCDCGCEVRMRRQWIDQAGLPMCGCGSFLQEPKRA